MSVSFHALLLTIRTSAATVHVLIFLPLCLVHTLDAAVYFWLPQINITILRLFQGRNLLHRMVGRTVVIGDIPYVAQCAEAFLSKVCVIASRLPLAFKSLNCFSPYTISNFRLSSVICFCQIFAVSYSIAGLNVLSGNPSDHFVHRHTYVSNSRLIS
jgi:hypothetical protein